MARVKWHSNVTCTGYLKHVIASIIIVFNIVSFFEDLGANSVVK